jgi:hypothetical protein
MGGEIDASQATVFDSLFLMLARYDLLEGRGQVASRSWRVVIAGNKTPAEALTTQAHPQVMKKISAKQANIYRKYDRIRGLC